MPWNPDDPKLNATKLSGISVVLTTQTKVDDTRLRKRQTDMLPRLLEILAREERKLPVIDLVANPS